MDNEKHNQPPIFTYYERRPSLDRLVGIGTPTSGRYFPHFADQVIINQHLHAQDHVSIARTMSWAKSRGLIGRDE